MDTEDLEILADKENISIVAFKLHNKKAFAIMEYGERAVIIDKDKLNGDSEYKLVLAEELGHIFCNALYPLNPIFALQARKAERRAYCWCVSQLLPYPQLKAASREYRTAEELAEFFNVPTEFLRGALEYYKEKGKGF